MAENEPVVYPYIPNSNPEVKRRMLAEIGAESLAELYATLPPEVRMPGPLNLPAPYLDETSLRRHVEGLLRKNTSCSEMLSFLGGGCYQHAVPAICDEINGRSEFLTAYAGEPYEDHGRFQALFEYASMMGELLEMDVVNVPTYDGLQAAATAVRMACRITGRSEALIAKTVNPERRSKIQDYCQPDITLRPIPYSPETGAIDFEACAQLVSDQTACLYFENPSCLGVIEPNGAALGERLHAAGALLVVGADPSSLGVLSPPSAYGADIACGDIQPLGMHMNYGGGQAGYLASRDEPRFVLEYPSRLFGLAPTSVPGEVGLGDVAYERTSFAQREKGKEFVGTAAALWGLTAGVYLALLGPQGMRDLGVGILERTRYAILRLNEIAGVKAPLFEGAHFKEFVVDFRATGKSVAEINQALLKHGIFGGLDLSRWFPELDGCALYAFTEVHTKEDIDRLAETLREVCGGRSK